MEKQAIHCTVHNCSFCNEEQNHCNLSEIKVCNCSKEHEKEATMCDSFREKSQDENIS